MVNTSVTEIWENREGLEDYEVRWHWITDTSNPGFTAVIRVKDEAQSLPWTLPGVLRSVKRVIVVDNLSTDGTADVARSVAEEMGLEDRLEVVSYPFEVSRCGPEHLQTPPDSVHSLTYYYNWSFSKVESRYALKWDGDMVLTPQGEQVLQDLSWQTEGKEAAITMPRTPTYVESDRVAYLDVKWESTEPWGWRNSPRYTFGKAFDWELRIPEPEDLVLKLPSASCFELKWLDSEEFAHWSHTEFKAVINARKRREWDLFHSLRDGTELPEGVIRVESPKETHVVEHLRQNYGKLQQRSSGSEASPSVAAQG